MAHILSEGPQFDPFYIYNKDQRGMVRPMIILPDYDDEPLESGTSQIEQGIHQKYDDTNVFIGHCNSYLNTITDAKFPFRLEEQSLLPPKCTDGYNVFTHLQWIGDKLWFPFMHFGSSRYWFHWWSSARIGRYYVTYDQNLDVERPTDLDTGVIVSNAYFRVFLMERDKTGYRVSSYNGRAIPFETLVKFNQQGMVGELATLISVDYLDRKCGSWQLDRAGTISNSFKIKHILPASILVYDRDYLLNAIGAQIDEPDWVAAFTASLDGVEFFESNGIALANDVRHLNETIQGSIRDVKALANQSGSRAAKAASIFLSIHYGYKLMASDLKEAYSTLASVRKRTLKQYRLTSSPKPSKMVISDTTTFVVEESYRQSVYYDPLSRIITDLGKFIETMDLDVDFSNVWDMIPFSFVVDWFTNIGDLAQGIDDFFFLTQKSRVYKTIRSTRTRIQCFPHAGAEVTLGSYTIDWYKRQVFDDWYPIPKFHFQIKNPVTNFYHWIEGLALVISKRS